MRITQTGFLLWIGLCLSSQALAWTPCAIFCDKECGGPALISLGTAVAAETLEFAAQTADDTSSLLTAYEKLTTRINAATVSHAVVQTAAIDLLRTSVKGHLRAADLALFETVIDGDTISVSYPPDMVYANEANTRKTAALAARDIADQSYANYRALKVTEENIPRVGALQAMLQATENSSLVNAIGTTALDVAAAFTLNTLLPVMALRDNDVPPSGMFEVPRREQFSMLSARVMADVTAEHAVVEHTPLSWFYRYLDSTPQPNSSASLLLTPPLQRLDSDLWVDLIRDINETGLLRELTYLRAEENALLARSYALLDTRILLVGALVVAHNQSQ